MEQKSKNQIREQFTKDIGRLLWEERCKNRLPMDKVIKRGKVPRGVIDRIEIGRCYNIYQVFSICAYYNKKIKIELVD